ncbi:MAG: hypothetical protein AABX33_02500 [Nanoarchaeota archaeon]
MICINTATLPELADVHALQRPDEQSLDKLTQNVFLALHGGFSREVALKKFIEQYGQQYTEFGRFRDVPQKRKRFAYFGDFKEQYLVGFLDLGGKEGAVTLANAPVSELYPPAIKYNSPEQAFVAYLLSGGIVTDHLLRRNKIDADVTFDANFRSLNTLNSHDGPIFIASYSDSEPDSSTVHLVMGTNRDKDTWREVSMAGDPLQNIFLVERIMSYLTETGYKSGITNGGIKSLSNVLDIKPITILPPSLQFKPPSLASLSYS